MAPTPALLTRMSSPPSFDWAASIARCRVCGSVMSPTTGSIVRPRRGDLFGQFAQPVFASGDDHQVDAVAGQFQRHLAADAAGGAGDDGAEVV